MVPLPLPCSGLCNAMQYIASRHITSLRIPDALCFAWEVSPRVRFASGPRRREERGVEMAAAVVVEKTVKYSGRGLGE